MKRLALRAAMIAGALLSSAAGAPELKLTLRMATIVPDGTAFARELKAFGREVETETRGEVTVKWVWGGIAGDDVQSADRVDRGQLDGIASGGMLCEKRAPTHRALRLVGLYRTYQESAYVAGQLRPAIELEARANGFVYLADTGIGPSDVFSRRPLRTLAELKKERLWIWDTDDVQRAILDEMGWNVLPLGVAEAGKAYAENRHSGFISIPGAMLAFQWSAQAKYAEDVRLSYLTACLLVSNRAFDRLPIEHQQTLRLAAARLRSRLSDVMQRQDESLLGGLFQKQGRRRGWRASGWATS